MEELLPRGRALPASPAGDEMLLRDPQSGQVHFLNPTAALVWECCDGKTTVEACAERLRAAFDVPEEADLTADIREIVADFARKGLLDVSDPGV